MFSFRVFFMLRGRQSIFMRYPEWSSDAIIILFIAIWTLAFLNAVHSFYSSRKTRLDALIKYFNIEIEKVAHGSALRVGVVLNFQVRGGAQKKACMLIQAVI